MNPLLASAAAGALTMYFLDPQAGARRRETVREAPELAQQRLQRMRRDTSPARLAMGALGLVLFLRGGVIGRLGGLALMAGAAASPAEKGGGTTQKAGGGARKAPRKAAQKV
jgi:hypothetical protein